MQISVLILACLLAPFLAAVETVPIIACCGDSITSGTGTAANAPTAPTPNLVKPGETNPGGAWPNQLSILLSKNGTPAEVRNFGIGGATVTSYLSDSEHKKYRQAALDSKPQHVVIMLGTNDSRDSGVKTIYHDRMVLLIKQFAALSSPPTIWICTPPPIFSVRGGGLSPVDANLNAEILPTLLELAKDPALSVHLIDVHAAFVGKKELFPDLLHPGQDGAALLAKTVFTAIAPALAKPAKAKVKAK